MFSKCDEQCVSICLGLGLTVCQLSTEGYSTVSGYFCFKGAFLTHIPKLWEGLFTQQSCKKIIYLLVEF